MSLQPLGTISGAGGASVSTTVPVGAKIALQSDVAVSVATGTGAAIAKAGAGLSLAGNSSPLPELQLIGGEDTVAAFAPGPFNVQLFAVLP